MRGHCIALRRAESHRYARLIIAALLYNIAARRFLFLCVQVRTLPYKPPHENDMSRGALNWILTSCTLGRGLRENAELTVRY